LSKAPFYLRLIFLQPPRSTARAAVSQAASLPQSQAEAALADEHFGGKLSQRMSLNAAESFCFSLLTKPLILLLGGDPAGETANTYVIEVAI